jgi:cyanophycinase
MNLTVNHLCIVRCVKVRMFQCKYIFPILFLVLMCSVISYAQQQTPTNTSEFFSIGITGSKEDVSVVTEGGIVLMGGSTDVDEAIQWMIERAKGGDFLIIRASGSTGYNDYIKELGDLNSVETLLIDSREKALNKNVGKRIRQAEALFIAGGDQANYVNFWTDSEVSTAIDYLINQKKVPVGGTSAGCAVLSEIIFDAQKGTVTGEEALKNPYDTLVSLSKSFIRVSFLKNTIADQHYAARERQGRHVTFLARMLKDFNKKVARGIGVDEKTAVCIDKNGDAMVFGSGSAYFLQSNSIPETCEENQPLTWSADKTALKVITVAGSTNGTPAFNLSAWPTKPTQYWYVEEGILKMREN